MRAAASQRFRQELRVLRDGVLAAIDGAVLGDLEDGLGMYERLIDAVIQLRSEQAGEFGVRAPALWSADYGQEMTWLADDVSTFILRAFDRPAEPVFDRLVTFLLRLLKVMWSSGQIDAHGQVLKLSQLFYYTSLKSDWYPDADGPERILLRRTRSYVEYQLRFGDRIRDDIKLPYVRQVIGFMFSCSKMAVDRDSSALRGTVVEVKLLRETLDNRSRRGTSPAGAESVVAALRQLDGFCVGLVAYVLLRAESREKETFATSDQLTTCVKLLRSVSLSDAFQGALADDGQDFPWGWWETGLWADGQRSGFLGSMQDWIRRVAVIEFAIGAERATLLSRLASGDADEGEYQIRRLAQAALDVLRLEWLFAVYPEFPATQRLEDLSGELGAQATDLDERAKDARSSKPLEEEKVAAFAAAVEKAWLVPSPLRGDVLALSDIGAPPAEWMGYSQLIPKEFFISSDVFAEPADFGSEVGDALGRGEMHAVLACLSELPKRAIGLGALRDEVAESISRFRRVGFVPRVVVVGSWEAMRAIVGTNWRSSINEAEFRGAQVNLEYVDADPICIVTDITRALAIRRWVVPQVDRDFRRVASGRIQVSVREVTEAIARDLISGSPGLGLDEDGEALSEAEAIRKLRRAAHVRVWTKFAVSLQNGEACQVFGIAPDAPDPAATASRGA